MLDDFPFAGRSPLASGSDHIREKDGPWAVLAWLSILAYRNKDIPVGGDKVTVEQITKEHWAEYGRNFFSRYDYEGCESEPCNEMVEHLRAVAASSKKGDMFGTYELNYADDFEYTDPIDGSVASKQGVRFVFSDGGRLSSVFRALVLLAQPSVCTSSSMRLMLPSRALMRKTRSRLLSRSLWKPRNWLSSPVASRPLSSLKMSGNYRRILI